jgi:hypothetical protein
MGQPTQADGTRTRSNANEYDDRDRDVPVNASPVSQNKLTRVVSSLPDGEGTRLNVSIEAGKA